MQLEMVRSDAWRREAAEDERRRVEDERRRVEDERRREERVAEDERRREERVADDERRREARDAQMLQSTMMMALIKSIGLAVPEQKSSKE